MTLKWQDLATPATYRPVVAMEAPSTPNLREHWSKRARRTKSQRGALKRDVQAWLLAGNGPRLTITLTRVGKRSLDSDNLAAALKACRDGVADALKLDDGASWVEWRYAQRKGEPSVEWAMAVSTAYQEVAP
jgi:hypothetical protein